MNAHETRSPEMVRVPVEVLRHLFDLATDSPLVCSGSFETDDVNMLRAIAVVLGTDPNAVTPDEFISQYPHPHKRRMVNTRAWPVPTAGRGYRQETPEETAARNAAEAADDTCQAGPFGRRCGKLPADPIHTSTPKDTL